MKMNIIYLKNQICHKTQHFRKITEYVNIELLLIPSICTAKTIFNGGKVEILLKFVDIQNINNPKCNKT